MGTYIALLRGINVSGQKKIKMADLKAHLKELNFTDVQTYIQSGNVIFKHNNTASENLEKGIRQLILEKYEFEVAVIVLTPSELEYAITQNPFLKDPAKDRKRVYITFLSGLPLSANIKKLEIINHEPEAYILDKKTLYYFSPLGYANAKMSNNYFENKLKIIATTRNLNTVNTLLEMARKEELPS